MCAEKRRLGPNRRQRRCQPRSLFNPNGPDQALCRPPGLPLPIRNSSIFRPDFIAATSQRGRLPRPDQVSEVLGLRYFGSTLGYLRRAFPFWNDGESPD